LFAAPAPSVLKSTLPLIMKHPFGELFKNSSLVGVPPQKRPSVEAADMHCASVPTETEPAGHTFVSSVPYKNPGATDAVELAAGDAVELAAGDAVELAAQPQQAWFAVSPPFVELLPESTHHWFDT